jgi:hypothetical protein
MSGIPTTTNVTNTASFYGQESLTGGYIAAVDVSNRVITDLSLNTFVAPYIAAMYADASGTVGVLQKTKVEIVDIDRVFDISLNSVASAKILKGFIVRDVDVSGSITDVSADVSVSMANDASGDFIGALAAAIASTDLKDISGNSLTNWLKAEAQSDVTKLLSYDTLANLLEASVLASFNISLDASDGATDMWEVMSAGDAARRRLLFTQLNEDRIEKYALSNGAGTDASNERVTVLNFLPLVKGDKFVMVFDVVIGQYTTAGSPPSVGAYIQRVKKDAQEIPTNSTYILGTGVESSFADNSLTISKPTLRRVAVQLALGTDGTATEAFAFTRDGSAANGYTLSLA